jgi:hypothetical protein
VESQKKSGQRACRAAIIQEFRKMVSFKKRKNAKQRQHIHKPWKNEEEMSNGSEGQGNLHLENSLFFWFIDFSHCIV